MPTTIGKTANEILQVIEGEDTAEEMMKTGIKEDSKTKEEEMAAEKELLAGTIRGKTRKEEEAEIGPITRLVGQ